MEFWDLYPSLQPIMGHNCSEESKASILKMDRHTVLVMYSPSNNPNLIKCAWEYVQMVKNMLPFSQGTWAFMEFHSLCVWGPKTNPWRYWGMFVSEATSQSFDDSMVPVLGPVCLYAFTYTSHLGHLIQRPGALSWRNYLVPQLCLGLCVLFLHLPLIFPSWQCFPSCILWKMIPVLSSTESMVRKF